jgi:hypothetical protein
MKGVRPSACPTPGPSAPPLGGVTGGCAQIGTTCGSHPATAWSPVSGWRLNVRYRSTLHAGVAELADAQDLKSLASADLPHRRERATLWLVVIYWNASGM